MFILQQQNKKQQKYCEKRRHKTILDCKSPNSQYSKYHDNNPEKQQRKSKKQKLANLRTISVNGRTLNNHLKAFYPYRINQQNKTSIPNSKKSNLSFSQYIKQSQNAKDKIKHIMSIKQYLAKKQHKYHKNRTIEIDTQLPQYELNKYINNELLKDNNMYKSIGKSSHGRNTHKSFCVNIKYVSLKKSEQKPFTPINLRVIKPQTTKHNSLCITQIIQNVINSQKYKQQHIKVGLKNKMEQVTHKRSIINIKQIKKNQKQRLQNNVNDIQPWEIDSPNNLN